MIADSAGGAWTFGGSILTFAFPMILFIVVATALYVLYTKPESSPGTGYHGAERPVSYTRCPDSRRAKPGPRPGPRQAGRQPRRRPARRRASRRDHQHDRGRPTRPGPADTAGDQRDARPNALKRRTAA